MTDRIDKAIQAEQTRRLLNQIVNRALFAKSQPTGGALQVRPHMRPHTWVTMVDEIEGEPYALGIVFHTWPKHMTHLRFELVMPDGSKQIETAQFHELVSNGHAKGRFLMITKRWVFERLMREYRGLAAGDL